MNYEILDDRFIEFYEKNMRSFIMYNIKVDIYKNRKIIFTETYDDDCCDVKWSYRDYYLSKARYEDADKVVFKFVKPKKLSLTDFGEELPF